VILSDEYFHDSVVNYNYQPTPEDYASCDDLLTRVNALFEALGLPCEVRSGHRVPAKTQALIDSGHAAAKGGKHETSQAVDVADNENDADKQISDELLASYGLWREAPSATPSWCHLQNVPPGSGHRTFIP
jgi:hypothetical protein